MCKDNINLTSFFLLLLLLTFISDFFSSKIPFTNISQEQLCDIKSIQEMIGLIHTV